jgi:septin 7
MSKFSDYSKISPGDGPYDLLDERIHVCFFFIAAHRIKQQDVVFMKAIAPFVTVIPVIAKADSMTKQECTEFKKIVFDRLVNEKIDFFGKPSSKSSVQNYRSIYAVIGSSNTIKRKDGKLDWGREYKHGIALVHDKDHSQKQFLRKRVKLQIKHKNFLIN